MRFSDKDMLDVLFESYKENLLGQSPSVDSLEKLEMMSGSESMGAKVIDFLTQTNSTGSSVATSAKPFVEVVTHLRQPDENKIARHYFKKLLKLFDGELITVQQLGLLVEYLKGVMSTNPAFFETAPLEFFGLFHAVGQAEIFIQEFKKSFIAIFSTSIDTLDDAEVRSGLLFSAYRAALGGLDQREVAQVFAEVANELVTTKALPGPFNFKARMLSGIYKMLEDIDVGADLLRPDVKTILVDFSGEVPSTGSDLRDKALLCIRYGLNVDKESQVGILALIREKILGGDSDLFEEVVDLDSYLTKFIHAKYSKIHVAHTQKIASLVFAVCDAFFLQTGSAPLNKLLSFLAAPIEQAKFANIGHLIGQFGTNQERMRFIEILGEIAKRDPQAVLSYLQLRPYNVSLHKIWPLNFGVTTLYNCSVGPKKVCTDSDESSVEEYIKLLEFISSSLDKDASSAFIQKLLDPLAQGLSFAEILHENLPARVDLIFRLMRNNFLSLAVLEKLKNIKHAVAAELIKHSCSLGKEGAVNLLSSALTRKSYLGSYFYLPLASKPCALGRDDALDAIFAELKRRDFVAATQFTPAFAASSGAVSLFGWPRPNLVNELDAQLGMVYETLGRKGI